MCCAATTVQQKKCQAGMEKWMGEVVVVGGGGACKLIPLNSKKLLRIRETMVSVVRFWPYLNIWWIQSIARAATARFLKFCYEARKERRRILCGDISLYILCGVCLFFSKTAVHAKEASRAVIWMAKDGKNYTHLCIESQSFRFRQDSAGVA